MLAIVKVPFIVLDYQLALRKRNDNLFNRRYQFLLNLKNFGERQVAKRYGGTRMTLEWDDLAPYMDEAQYLF